MPGAMRCSRSSALLGKMILTRRTSMQHPEPKLRGRPDPIIAANQPAMRQLRHEFAMAQSSLCVLEDPFSHPINRQFFGTACSLNWSPSTQPMRRPSGRVRIFPPRTRLQQRMPELSKRNFKRDSRPSAMVRALASHPLPPLRRTRCLPVGLMRAIARKLRKCLVSRLAITQSAPWAKRFAYAIRSTGSSCPGRRALSAAGRRRIRITSRLCNLVPSDTESAMSSPCQFVGSITASSIARVTRPRGGVSFPSIRYRSRSSYGSTRGSMARPSRSVEAPSLGLQPQWKRPSKGPPSIQALMPTTPAAKLSMATQVNDLISTDRGRSRQHLNDTHYLRIVVRKLRKKIEVDPTRPRILLTELGIGYRLVR